MRQAASAKNSSNQATARRVLPAGLPEPVLRQAQEAIWNLAGSGIGVLEHSHRGPAISKVLAEAEADCRALAGISDDYHVLFLPVGAPPPFAILPLNFPPPARPAGLLWPPTDYRQTRAVSGRSLQAGSGRHRTWY